MANKKLQLDSTIEKVENRIKSSCDEKQIRAENRWLEALKMAKNKELAKLTSEESKRLGKNYFSNATSFRTPPPPSHTFTLRSIIESAGLTDYASQTLPLLKEIFSCMKENRKPDFSFIKNNPEQEDILVHLADFLCIDESKIEYLTRIRLVREQNVKAAALDGDLTLIQNLLQGGGCNISEEARGEAVKNAALGGHLDVVKELLKDRANISRGDHGDAIINAAKGGHLEIIRELLQDGATISERNRGLAVIDAAEGGHLNVVKELLQDEESNISESDRGYAVINAALGGHLNVVKELLQDEGSNISEQDLAKAIQKAKDNSYSDIKDYLSNL